VWFDTLISVITGLKKRITEKEKDKENTLFLLWFDEEKINIKKSEMRERVPVPDG